MNRSSNRGSIIIASLINFLLAIVEVLLGLRFILRLAGSSTVSSFVSFVYNVTNSLVSPFRGIVASSAVPSGGVVDWTAIIAMIIYAVAAWLLVALIRWVGKSTDYTTYTDRTTYVNR